MKVVSFIAGARSLNEQDLTKNLGFFKVPQASIESIRSKLDFKIFDEYVNILKGMYSMRFNGKPADGGATTITTRTQLVPDGQIIPPLITSLLAWQPTKYRKRKVEGRRERTDGN